MANISKREVSTKVQRRIEKELRGQMTSNPSAFLEELFTKTERIMLAKRLAVMFMLESGYSFAAIERLLKVSPTTIAKIWREQKEGKYSKLIARCRRAARAGDRDPVAWLFGISLPPQGRGRWKHVFAHTAKS